MRGAGHSPRALRPDPGPAMSFFRRKGSGGVAGGGRAGPRAAVGRQTCKGFGRAAARLSVSRSASAPTPAVRCAALDSAGEKVASSYEVEGDCRFGLKVLA